MYTAQVLYVTYVCAYLTPANLNKSILLFHVHMRSWIYKLNAKSKTSLSLLIICIMVFICFYLYHCIFVSSFLLFFSFICLKLLTAMSAWLWDTSAIKQTWYSTLLQFCFVPLLYLYNGGQQ